MHPRRDVRRGVSLEREKIGDGTRVRHSSLTVAANQAVRGGPQYTRPFEMTSTRGHELPLAALPRIQRVTKAVADQVEGKNGQRDRDSRNDGDVGIRPQERAPI